MTGPGRAARTRLRQLEPRRTSRLAGTVERIAGETRARGVREVLDEYSEIGGDLLASALALRSLLGFMVLLLLLAAFVGFLSGDAAFRDRVIGGVASAVPGLDLSVDAALRELVAGRTILSLIGVLGLTWSGAGIYGSLDDAMRRVFPGGRQRSLIVRRARGILAVLVFLVALGALAVLGATWAVIEAQVTGAGALTWRVGGPVLTAVIASGAILATFRLVPTAPPSIRDAVLPAISAGLIVAVMTAAYALIAPRLVGALHVFGAIAAVIGTLLWLSWLFRVVIVAGVWAARRRDEAVSRAEGPA